MILRQIIESKDKELLSLPTIDSKYLAKSNNNFLTAIHKAKVAIIAELKARSPSEGIIDPHYDLIKIATEYEQGGACALSILTDKPFFGGSFEDIQRVRQVTSLPILCKEFIIDEKQVYHARKSGADACLLIVRCLTADKLKLLIECVESLNMTALVEVFDEQETKMALNCGATLIGVNNRDLDSLEMDMNNIARLAKIIPNYVTLLSLSGVKTAEDLYYYATTYDGVLAGTLLMKANDKVALLRSAIYTRP
ncbi:indole-3-glycerol phosphate synthase TrpC [Fastidiosibacter lacustris]|uniref:indole-3-glycerol phosphate synthase TrpC n=1 Tax=Fastidiosibacter lacustris TaxID=2056695 RepID=UPI000E35668B|nr:indole-3-glycerol-phosphate synthase [Fastidiosibacter lacustris]